MFKKNIIKLYYKDYPKKRFKISLKLNKDLSLFKLYIYIDISICFFNI